MPSQCSSLLPILIIIFELLIQFIRNQCEIQLDLTRFQCTRQKLTEIPSYIHKNTIDLDLSHNLIEILHEDSFSRLPVIRRLTLGNNRIYKITERAFLPIAHNLTYLDLRHNQIMSSITIPFPVSAFAPLVNVKHLDLSGNPLGFLPNGFLRYMGQSLNRLDLSSLAIGIKLEPGAFGGLSRVHHLNLAYNTFSELTEESFGGLRPEHFSYLNLDGVHWHCDCHIMWLRRWLNRIPRKALQKSKNSGGECISPPNFKGQPLILLNFTSLQCEPRILNTIPPRNEADLQSPIHVIGYEGQNLTIMCAFISEPKMNVNWYHEGILIQPHWSRITQTITPGTKFTTSLHFQGLQSSKHSGYYQCQASNRKGQASASFRLDVSPNTVGSSGQSKQTHMTNQDLFDYFGHVILLIGSIIIANVGLILIGFITYRCLKKRRRSQIVKHIAQDHSDPNNKHPEEILSLQSQYFNSAATNMYNHHIQHPSINTTDAIICSPNRNPESLFHSSSTAGLMSPTFELQTSPRTQHPKFSRTLLSSNPTPLNETSRSKLGDTPLLNRTPSLQSSDMGYPGSGSSQTGGSFHLTGDAGKPVQNRQYYTLSLRQKTENPELIYRPALTEFFEADQNSYPSSDHNVMNIFDEIRLMEQKFDRNSSPESLSPSPPGHHHDQDHRGTACPVHGSKSDHLHEPSCALHSHIPPDVCPIHGLSNTSLKDDHHSAEFGKHNRQDPVGYHRRFSMQNIPKAAAELGFKSRPVSGSKMSTIPRNWTRDLRRTNDADILISRIQC